MQTTKILSTLCLLLATLITACGGSGGSSTSGSTPTTTTASGVTTTTSAVTTTTTSSTTTTSLSGSIVISLTTNRTSGVAPLAVFFDATGTTSPLTTMPFHEIKYTWGFGDPAGNATWAYGSRVGQSSKNVAYGAVAGHVFETPGTYTVTVTAFDGTNTNVTTTTITVTDPNVVFSGTNTVCVANGTLPVAGANGCPAGAAVSNVATTTGLVTLANAGNIRILLKRGDSWDVSSAAYITGSNGIFGAYGSGATPLIRLITNNIPFFFMAGVSNWTLMDLELIGVGGATHHIVSTQGHTGSNITLLRLRSTLTGGAEVNGDGIFMVDCNASQLAGGFGFVGFYSEYSSHVAALGNRIYDVSGIEHNIRTQGSTKVVVSNNTIFKPRDTKNGVTIRGRSVYGSPATWSGVWVEHIVVSDNDIDAGPTSGPAALVTFGPQNTVSDERVRDVLFERNWVHGNAGTLVFTEASERATIRNNLFSSSDTATYASSVINVNARNTVGTPAPTSTFIYNNSFYRPNGSTSKFEAIGVDSSGGVLGNPTGTVARNNLVYAPFATDNDYTYSGLPTLIGSYTAATWVSSNNSTDVQIKNTAPGFITPPISMTDWKPTSGYAVGSGVAVPVWDDFFTIPRTGAYDIGAVVH
jgi:hypothetical protein